MQIQDYLQTHDFSGSLGGYTIRYTSRPGFSDWDVISPTSLLLAEHISPANQENLLILGCGHGALAAALARQSASTRITLQDFSQVALDCAQRTLQLNQVQGVTLSDRVTLLPEATETFDRVAMLLPKGRRLARRWLVEAFHLLRPGCKLFLAGPNDLGIQPIIRDGQELFGNSVLLGYRKGHRVASFRKPEVPSQGPVWRHEPGISPGTWIQFPAQVGSRGWLIHSLPGVFSDQHLDEGSLLLLDNFDIAGRSRILDAGCGYGILGMAAAARLAEIGQAFCVDLVDANLLAVASARQNIHYNQVPNANVLASDLLAAVRPQKYDLILSNPPFHTGKAVNYLVTNALIQQAHQALEPGGQFIIVANRFIRYDRMIQDVFGNAAVTARTNLYHIIAAEKER